MPRRKATSVCSCRILAVKTVSTEPCLRLSSVSSRFVHSSSLGEPVAQLTRRVCGSSIGKSQLGVIALMADFSAISRMYCTASQHPVLKEFCSVTNHKLILHRAGRGWLLRIGSGTWSTPAYGTCPALPHLPRRDDCSIHPTRFNACPS